MEIHVSKEVKLQNSENCLIMAWNGRATVDINELSSTRLPGPLIQLFL